MSRTIGQFWSISEKKFDYSADWNIRPTIKKIGQWEDGFKIEKLLFDVVVIDDNFENI